MTRAAQKKDAWFSRALGAGGRLGSVTTGPGHSVDADVARAEFAREVAGQAELSGLRCRVVAALQRTRASAGHRCDVYDGPAALEVLRGNLRAEERPLEVDRQDAVPVSFGDPPADPADRCPRC